MIYQNKDITTPIVPSTVKYYTLPGDDSLDLKAICCFSATGFFLDDETYYLNQKAFRPATTYRFDVNGNVENKNRHFTWHYSPRDISFNQTLDEFSALMDSLVQRSTLNKKVILPISGGLDSRTLAASLSDNPGVLAYSYQFEDGPPENHYGESIANALSFSYQPFTIPSGYLWNVILDLAKINKCYADFINPRQMAVWQRLNGRGDVLMLGHGGDLFFDGMGVPDDWSESRQHDYLLRKLIKPAGWELGEQLWKAWGMVGDFREYLEGRILSLLRNIQIENANARLRAFKTEYYVARWTAVNLEIFQRQLPISLPFFEDDMCRFICTVPEQYLVGRKLEIEYIRRKSRTLAEIPWQKYFPCNLYNYSKFNSIPIKGKRAIIKGKRVIKKHLLGKRSDMKNWELQFLGKSNDERLRSYLFDKSFEHFLPASLVRKVYKQFQMNPAANSHSISMLLTLSLFNHLFLKSE